MFGSEANNRRSANQTLLGQTLQGARDFIASPLGRFLVRALPFENREGQNDTHEVLYFRDSGIHRRLIERTVTVDQGAKDRFGSDAKEGLRTQRVEAYVAKRWEAFVITTIIDLVADRCGAFAYRHEETREIDLVQEWNDQTRRSVGPSRLPASSLTCILPDTLLRSVSISVSSPKTAMWSDVQMIAMAEREADVAFPHYRCHE